MQNRIRQSSNSMSEVGPNIASPSNMGTNNYMKIEGAGEISMSNPEQERGFESIKYDIGRNTKDMVNKIFKAASSNNDAELNSLLDQVETRALEMAKGKGKELSSLNIPSVPSPATNPNNARAPDGQVLTDLSKNLNADSQLQFRNNSDLGGLDQKNSKERNVSSLKSQAKKGDISI